MIENLKTGLLSRYPQDLNVTWNAVVRNDKKNESLHGGIEGHELISFLNENSTVKVFERLNSKLKRQNMSRRKFLWSKMDLFQEYSHPKPFPPDMFLRMPLGSPNQAYVILGTKGTGKKEKRIR